MAGQTYDYVIVGGGSAGCVLAARLERARDASVLLLEAGPADTDRLHPLAGGLLQDDQRAPDLGLRDRAARATPDGRADDLPAGPRAGRRQLDQRDGLHPRPRAGLRRLGRARRAAPAGPTRTSCPISAAPRTTSASATACHGTGGPLGVSDLISPHYLTRGLRARGAGGGPALQPRLQRRAPGGLRPLPGDPAPRRGAAAAAVGYLRPALARPNLTVLTGCHATRILVERGRAVGVEYVAQGGEPQTARAEREVMVACGRRRLAQAPAAVRHRPGRRARARSASRPLHDLPGVGRNLQDHIDVYVICELTGPHSYDRHTRPHRMLLGAASSTSCSAAAR